MINRVEKKISGSGFIQCCGFKDFSSPSIVQKYMGDRPVAEKKQNKLHRMKQRERGIKRGKERREGGRKEGKQARRRNHLGWCSLAHSCTHMPLQHLQVCSSAGCKALECWRSSKFCSPNVELYRDSMLEMHSSAQVLPTYLASSLYIQQISI